MEDTVMVKFTRRINTFHKNFMMKNTKDSKKHFLKNLLCKVDGRYAKGCISFPVNCIDTHIQEANFKLAATIDLCTKMKDLQIPSMFIFIARH